MADLYTDKTHHEQARRPKRRHKPKEINKEQEKKLKQEKEAREKITRERILNNVRSLFRKLKHKRNRDVQKELEVKEWERYINCNRMPYPELPTSVRQHFIEWMRTSNYADMNQVDSDLSQYLPIFEIMKKISNIPLKPDAYIKNLREIMDAWKFKFVEKIDYACFLVIKQLENNFLYLDFYTRDYHRNFENFKIGMWTLLDVPMKSTLTREAPVIHFPDVDMTVGLPSQYKLKPIIIRVMYTYYDFFSDSTRSRFPPKHPKPADLLEDVIRCQDLKDAINLELMEIDRKRKMPEVEKVDQTSHHHYDALSDARSSRSDRTLEYSQRTSSFLSLRSEASSSIVGAWAERGSISSESSGASKLSSTRSKPIVWGSMAPSNPSVASNFVPGEGTKRPRAPWESKQPDGYFGGDRGASKISLSTFASKRPSKIFEDISEEVVVNADGKVILQRKLDPMEQWSYPDLDLLRSRDSEAPSKSITFFDLLFYLNEVSVDTKDLSDLVNEFEIDEKKVAEITTVGSMISLFIKREDERYKKYVESMTVKLDPYEVNLRKFHSFCGIYYVDLVLQTQDFWRLKMGDYVQIQIGPYQLEKDHFYYKETREATKTLDSVEIKPVDFYFNLDEYTKEDEEVEEDEEIIMEEEEYQFTSIQVVNKPQVVSDEHFVTVKMALSQNLLWFMKPLPAVWDKEKQMWSTEHVYDVEHDRKENTIEMKLGKLGPITMFTLRFHELPFKNWTLAPDDEEEEITLTLEGQNLNIEFKVVNEKLCLNYITGYSQHLLDGIVGKMVTLDEMVDKLKSMGLDIFPEEDSFLYVDGIPAKPWGLEDHTYFSMAMYAKILEYTASSWNLAVGQDDITFRCRLLTPYNPLAYRTYRANNFSCDMLMLEDESLVFSGVTNKDMGFFPDVYSILSKLYGRNINFEPADLPKIFTVYNLLVKTKVLTYSGSMTKTI